MEKKIMEQNDILLTEVRRLITKVNSLINILSDEEPKRYTPKELQAHQIEISKRKMSE